MHNGVDHRFANHLLWQQGLVVSLGFALFQTKMLWQIIQNGGFQFGDQHQQGFTQIQRGVEALLRVFHPLSAGDAHIVHAHGG